MEAVGGVAAALQLADVALQSLINIYSVARDMKEVPKKLHELCCDLERFAGLLANLGKEAAQPESRFTRAPAWQVQGLVTSLKAATACSDTLKASLAKALPSRDDSKLKRTWRAFASLPREHDIFVQCDRLQRLKLDIQLDLQSIGISLINLANSSLDDIKAQTDPRGYARVSASFDTVTSRLVAIEDSNHRIEDLAQAIHRMVLSEGTGRASTARSIHDPYEAMPIYANDGQMKQAAIECCRQLAKYPTDLASAARSSGFSSHYQNQEPSNTQDVYNKRLNISQEEFCYCLDSKSVSTHSFGPIEVVTSHTRVHEALCPIFSNIKNKTRQTIRARLRPFINKTIEIVFQSSLGSGGSSQSQSLKYYNTVSRQLSPAFQLFDRINVLGNDDKTYDTLKTMKEKIAKYNTPRARYMTWLEDITMTYYDASVITPYSDDEMLVLLDKIRVELEEMFQSGAALPTDRDEFGNTLIHELIFTWHYLGKRSPPKLAYGIQKFASYLYRRGVDFGASAPVLRSSTIAGSAHTFSFSISSNRDPSVVELAYYALFDQRRAINNSTEASAGLHMPIPLTILSEMNTELGSSLLGDRFVGEVERIHRRSSLLDLASLSRGTHDIIYDLELNALHYAILQRSTERVISLMKKYPPEKESLRAEYPFSVVECAFGWTEGLEILCTAGYSVFGAVELAVYRHDTDLLKILVSESDLSTYILNYALCLDCYSHSSKSRSESNKAFNIWRDKDFHREVIDILVRTLKLRREELRQLALRELPITSLQSLGLDTSKSMVLDTKAARTAQMLDDGGIFVPVRLRPGDMPVFQSFDICCPEGGFEVADALYQAGFREVDALGLTGAGRSTRLDMLTHELFISDEAIAWSGASASAIRWLLNHGAYTDADKLLGRGKKSLLHGLAEFYDGYPFTRWDCKHDESLLFQLNQEYERQDPDMDNDMRSEWDSNSEGGSSYSTTASAARSNASSNCYMGDIEDEILEGDDSSTRRNRTRKSPETCARRKLLQTVARNCTTLSDGCDCYCSTTGCLPTHKLPMLFTPTIGGSRNTKNGWVKPWRQIQNDLFSWISDTTSTSHNTFPRQSSQTPDPHAREYLEGAIRREIFERLGMAHTCCSHGQQNIRAEPRGPTMSPATRKELHEEDAEAKAQLDLFTTTFTNLISSPRRRSWPTRRLWTYWWSIVDEILPPLLPWERGMRYCVSVVEKLPLGVESVLLDASAEIHVDALRRAGYHSGGRGGSSVDFVDVIRCHLGEFLGSSDGGVDAVERGLVLDIGAGTGKVGNGGEVDVRLTMLRSRRDDAGSGRYVRKRESFGRGLVERRMSV